MGRRADAYGRKRLGISQEQLRGTMARMFGDALGLLALAFWALLAAAIVIFVSAIVRISRSFEQISVALTDIAEALRIKRI
jgi:hypothetical protein